jgi:hypothetical protein
MTATRILGRSLGWIAVGSVFLVAGLSDGSVPRSPYCFSDLFLYGLMLRGLLPGGADLWPRAAAAAAGTHVV